MSDPKDKVATAIVKAQADLEAALRELDALPVLDPGTVAFAAHALNNYLTVTGGTVDLILARLTDFPDAQIRIWLEGLQHVTNLMSRTVGQLMNASAGTETVYRLEQAHLPMLVERVCHYYQRVAAQKDIRILFRASEGVPPVRTDRVVIAAVLDNVLSNAVKYSPLGASIVVEVRGERGGVVCAVRDQGPGLSREDHAKLFQRGMKLAPRPTAGEPSSGYGLAVAKELIEKVGGSIWCESELGCGATFSFRVPVYQ
jgi:signal transduction histidine kinase